MWSGSHASRATEEEAKKEKILKMKREGDPELGQKGKNLVWKGNTENKQKKEKRNKTLVVRDLLATTVADQRP